MLIGLTFSHNFTDSSLLPSLDLSLQDSITILTLTRSLTETPFFTSSDKEITTLTSGSFGNGFSSLCSMVWSSSGWSRHLQTALLTHQAEPQEDGISRLSTSCVCVIQQTLKSFSNVSPSSGKVSLGGGLLDGSQLLASLGFLTLEELQELFSPKYMV